MDPHVAERLAPFGTSIFASMTALANRHGAVNLSQGFPDFDGPEFVKHAASEAIAAGKNQYARPYGALELVRAIAADFSRRAGVGVDPEGEVTVTSGCTEAIPASILGLVNPGDTMVMFEPFYDSYRACAAIAGARVRVVTLHAPTNEGSAGRDRAASLCDPSREFWFDPDELARAMRGARFVLLNTPHNPTGKVFTRAELELLARHAIDAGAVAIVDEVYERLVYDADRPHLHLASLPGMTARTVTLSSLGKTFSLTGWKVGWAIAAPALTSGVRAAHQFLTFATATPLQAAGAVAIERGEPAIRELVERYRAAREFLSGALLEAGFRVHHPAGTYFIMADHGDIRRRLGLAGDTEFCEYLTREIGVAAIPPSPFYARPELARDLVRFAFCKKEETLARAAERLRTLRSR